LGGEGYPTNWKCLNIFKKEKLELGRRGGLGKEKKTKLGIQRKGRGGGRLENVFWGGAKRQPPKKKKKNEKKRRQGVCPQGNKKQT